MPDPTDDQGQQGGQQQQQQQQQSNDSMQKLLDISNATNIDDAVKWAENANSRLGSSINLPSESNAENNAEINRKLTARGYDMMIKPDMNDPEQVKSLNTLRGVPDETAGYKLPEQTDDFKYNEAGANKFVEGAHKYGLTQAQMEGLLRDNATLAMEQGTAFEQERFDGITSLKSELGFAYDAKLELAGEVMKLVNPDFDVSTASRAQIEGALRVADHYGQMAAEGTNFGRTPETVRMTPDEAKTKIKEVTGKLISMKPNDLGYQDLMAQKRALYKEAYPDKASPDGTARVGGVQFT